MITKFKLYEDIDDTPKIGDYVYCQIDKTNKLLTNSINEYLNNNVGRIVKLYYTLHEPLFDVSFKKKPDFISEWNFKYEYEKIGYIRCFDSDEIIVFSKNKKDLEHLKDAKKYNI